MHKGGIRLDSPDLRAPLGADEIERRIRTWRAMIAVLDTGEHYPHHLRFPG